MKISIFRDHFFKQTDKQIKEKGNKKHTGTRKFVVFTLNMRKAIFTQGHTTCIKTFFLGSLGEIMLTYYI